MDDEVYDSGSEAYDTDSLRSEDDDDDELANHFAKPGSQVCGFCENLLLAVIGNDNKSTSYQSPDHYEWFYTLKRSAQTCGLCWTLFEAADDYLTNTPDLVFPWDRNMRLGSYEMYAATYVKSFTDKDVLRTAGIHEFTFTLGFTEDMPRFRFLLMTDDGQGMIVRRIHTNGCSLIPGPIPQRAVWSSRIPMQLGSRLPVINDWLKSCEVHHARCKESISNIDFCPPTRLVDLFESSHTGSFNPRLVLTADISQSSFRYTTLSHRWGHVQPVRTLTGNLTEFTKSIFPLYSRTKRKIPKTFSDAMKITRALGLRYIWIDSLCIVQDDRADWERGASRMADVYSSSYLNIAAIDGPNCESGCGLDIQCKVMSLTTPRMAGKQIKVRGLAADPAHVFASQLNARGWVFQELMLAPRILYCGRDQFFWQCFEKVYSEDGYIDHDMALHIPREHEYESTAYDWPAQVRDFSQRKFTVLSDRLPALYGVVHRYQRETGFTPILGSWMETLVDDLAWRTRQVYRGPAHSLPLERSDVANMPTWSWLSLHSNEHPVGVLYFPHLAHRVILTSIEDVKVTWKGEPHFSGISSTRLIVTGPLQMISLQYDAGRRRLHKNGDEENHETDTYVVRLDEAFKDELQWGDTKHFWCLQLERARVEEDEISTFLVIQEVDKTDGMRRFRRLGCGRMPERDVRFDSTVTEILELM